MSIQLVIPMAGKGSRFEGSRFVEPKPLIRIHDFMMIEHVIGNLISPLISKTVLVVQKGFGLKGRLEAFSSEVLNRNLTIIEIDFLTRGPAESAFLAQKHLDKDLPLVIANSDQYVDTDISLFYEEVLNPNNLGVVMTMEDDNPKWSYAKVDKQNCISRIVEKVVISKFATTGVYGFSTASSYFESFALMESKDDTHAGEFYVGPAYNHLSRELGCVSNFSVGVLGDVMFGLGVPDDLEKFISNHVSIKSNLKLRAIHASK